MSNSFTVLITEDDEISFELYKLRLQDLGIKILHAKNGLEAIKLVKENPNIDLILMDIRMPVLNGYEATKQIRQIRRDVPIIAQTTYAMIPKQRTILELGFTYFLSKPVKEVKLFGLIKKYMEKSK